MLRLEREAIAESIDASLFARDSRVEEIPGVELHARFGRRDIQRTPTRRLHHVRSTNERIRRDAGAIQHEVVIVAVAVANLRIRLVIDARADRHWSPEIEWRACDGQNLARR